MNANTTPTPVTLTPEAPVIRARASMTAAQVTAFQGLLDQAVQAGLIILPEGKTVRDIALFTMTTQPNGGGLLQTTIK